jgi:hypothetical protein
VFGDGEHKNIEKELEKELMRTFFDEAPRKADNDNYACPKNPQVLARVVPMDEVCLVHQQVMDHGSWIIGYMSHVVHALNEQSYSTIHR